MVKKKLQEKSDDKFFKYFLAGFVMIVIIAAILLNTQDNKEVVIVNEGDVIMHYFYMNTCPHCKEQEEFHKTLLSEYPNLKILEYEMGKDSSRDKYIELAEKIGLDTQRIATPTTIIGDQSNVGYVNEIKTGDILRKMIENEILNNKKNLNVEN